MAINNEYLSNYYQSPSYTSSITLKQGSNSSYNNQSLFDKLNSIDGTKNSVNMGLGFGVTPTETSSTGAISNPFTPSTEYGLLNKLNTMGTGECSPVVSGEYSELGNKLDFMA